jgi:hypothetical protein
MLLAPLIVFFHECGHYFFAVVFGATPEFYLTKVRVQHEGPLTSQAAFWIAAGGPLVDALLAVTGFLWLRYSRHPRIGTSPARTGWLGIVLVLSVANYVVGFVTRLIILKPPGDAPRMSLAMGLPIWSVPSLLSLFSLVLIGAAIRLFPRGHRLVPFGCAFLGWFFGVRMLHFCVSFWENGSN